MRCAAVRPPAVAGTFYPADAAQLRTQVNELLADNPAPSGTPKALIAPHAGYIYSGPIAARAYSSIADRADTIRQVVLLGPAHRAPLRGLALPAAEIFRTPLGDVTLDAKAMANITPLPQISRSDIPHHLEHSLEVQLPFLQVQLHDFTLVPLVVGQAEPRDVAEVLAALWGSQETLIVISTDLSHYYPYETARRLDADTAQRIEDGSLPVPDQQACGACPLNGLLSVARSQHMKIERLDLRNSGDTAGDRRRVVGYGAWACHEA